MDNFNGVKSMAIAYRFAGHLFLSHMLLKERVESKTNLVLRFYLHFVDHAHLQTENFISVTNTNDQHK